MDGSGTITSLPALPIGETVFLQMARTPTFANSARLICSSGVNYIAVVGDFVIARSKGDGVWQLYVLPSTPTVIRSYLTGLTLSTAGGSASFGVGVGFAADSTNAAYMALTSAYTKTTGAWTVGSGSGSFDGTGAAPSATAGWYHVFLIQRPDTGVVDILTSNSATAPTLPASYTLFRRIGSMKTNGSFQWILFSQNGDEFLWDVPVQDALANNPGIAAVLRILTVPTGVKVNAILSIGAQETNVMLAGMHHR